MADKMHLNESFVKAKTLYAKFNQVDLHIEEVIGESTMFGEKIYHM
jgi:hypothetical protein